MNMKNMSVQKRISITAISMSLAMVLVYTVFSTPVLKEPDSIKEYVRHSAENVENVQFNLKSNDLLELSTETINYYVRKYSDETVVNRKINKDFAGILSCDIIDMHTNLVFTTDNEYYLRKNLSEQYSIGGTVFFDKSISQDLFEVDNLILFGQDMEDSEGFSNIFELENIYKLKDSAFLLYANDYIGMYKGVYSGYVNDEELLLVSPNRELIESKYGISQSNQILTLVTTKENSEDKFVVVCEKTGSYE